MEGFKVEKETKKAKIYGRTARILLTPVFSGIALGSLACCGGIPIGGYPVTTTTIALTKGQVVAIADSILSNELGIVMEHDVQFILSSNDQVIAFTADGYNLSNKIVYEYTGRSDYTWYESANETLSADESAFISNDTFYDWKIVEITSIYEEGISNRLIAFVTNLSN
jgi:hypothetical protein